jgi:CBS domain-containing protein
MFDDVPVSDWMTDSVISVAPDLPIATAHQIMKNNDIRRLPVVDGEKLIGIITIGDVREASPSDATTLSIWELNYLWSQLTVEKVMTKEPFTAKPTTSIFEVARSMLEDKISGLPVVDDDNNLVGIITESDIFKMIVKKQS